MEQDTLVELELYPENKFFFTSITHPCCSRHGDWSNIKHIVKITFDLKQVEHLLKKNENWKVPEACCR